MTASATASTAAAIRALDRGDRIVNTAYHGEIRHQAPNVVPRAMAALGAISRRDISNQRVELPIAIFADVFVNGHQYSILRQQCSSSILTDRCRQCKGPGRTREEYADILAVMVNEELGHKIRSRLARFLPPMDQLAPAPSLSTMNQLQLPPATPLTSRNGIGGKSLRNQERVDSLQRDLGVQFGNPSLLREALTHRSYLNEINQAWPSNERLEFLGDTVLGLITTDYLFGRFPSMSEGELTNLRSALVRTETLARFAQDINLGQYLFLGRGEEMSQGRRRPAGMACAFEALLGAIYLDQGYPAVQDFAMRFIDPELRQVIEGRLHKNAKSTLQELVQARMQMTPTYHLIDEIGPDHAKSFTAEVRVGTHVLGHGHDRSKRGAEQSAAEAALEQLKSDSPTIPTSVM